MTIPPGAVAVLSTIILLNIEGAPTIGWCGNGYNNNNNKKTDWFPFPPPLFFLISGENIRKEFPQVSRNKP